MNKHWHRWEERRDQSGSHSKEVGVTGEVNTGAVCAGSKKKDISWQRPAPVRVCREDGGSGSGRTWGLGEVSAALTQPCICFVAPQSLPICKMGIYSRPPADVAGRVTPDYPGGALRAASAIGYP